MDNSYYKPNPTNPDYQIDNDNFRNIDFNEYINEQENILLGYDTVAWNVTLSALSQFDWLVLNKNENATVSRIVIARSGVTARYTVNSMTFDTVYPGDPGKTTNSSSLSFDIEIHEQNSMRFFDELVALSNKLRYRKFCDIPMILDLEFVGYKDGVPMVIPGASRRWQLRILNVTAKTSQSASGMIYNVKAVTAHGYIEDNIRILNEFLGIDCATVPDYVAKLEEHINRQMYDQYEYLVDLFPDYFAERKFVKFIIHPDLMNLGIKSSKTDPLAASPNGKSNSSTFSHSPNQTIQSAIDVMMDCVSPNVASEGRMFVQLVPNAIYVGYDPARGISVYKYYLYLIPYQLGDMNDYQDVMSNFNASVFFDKVTDILTVNSEESTDDIPLLNIKRYDYVFSGRNEEILNLELKFDNQYLMAVERNVLSLQDTDNTSGTTSNDRVIDSDRLGTARSDLLGGIAVNHMVTSGVPYYALSEDEKNKYAQYKKWAEETRRNQNDPTMTAAEQERVYGGVKPIDEYLEDTRESYDLTEMEAFSDIDSVTIIPIDYKNTKETNSGKRNDNTTPFEQKRRLIRSNYYNRSFMLKIDMKVFGDPFWIPDHNSINTRLNQIIDTGIYSGVDPSKAEFLTCEPYFVLNLHPAREISDETGVLSTDVPTLFSQNMYRVLSVKHEFTSGGKFTQRLTGALVVRGINKE